jgi:hypothetical protein
MNKLSKNLMMVSLGALLGGTAQGAVLSTDDFLAGNEGWADRDAGVDMTVGWTGVGPGFGNPPGSMQGTFACAGGSGVGGGRVPAERGGRPVGS